jgi:hypothetical protein
MLRIKRRTLLFDYLIVQILMPPCGIFEYIALLIVPFLIVRKYGWRVTI